LKLSGVIAAAAQVTGCQLLPDHARHWPFIAPPCPIWPGCTWRLGVGTVLVRIVRTVTDEEEVGTIQYSR